MVAALRAYIPRPTKMPAGTSTIDRERIIECSKDPQNPDNAALITSLRDRLHSCLSEINQIEDLTRLPHLVANIAGDVFSRQELPTKYQNPVSLVSGITSMWRQWMLIKRSPAAGNLREMIYRWKIWSAYCKHQKAHKQRCRARKKQYLIDKMKEAQRASAAMDLRGVYQVVRCLAPKAPRRLTQLRGPQGQMHTRTEEAEIFCQYFSTKFTSKDDSSYQPIYHNHSEHDDGREVGIDAAQLTQLFMAAPLRKAVPTGHPPSAIWRLCADITANKLEQVINSGWLNAPMRIPQGWSDAYLVLIRKSGKSGKEPGHHRPIGLQDQIGKLVFRHVLEPYVPHIHQQSCTFPQYGYLPGRSTIHALRRVCEHCAKVRDVFMARNHRRSRVVFRSLLIWQVPLTPSLDSSFRGMQEIGLPDRVVEVVMEWHCVRQGCVIAPLLWLIYSHLTSTELASLIGEAATKSLLNIYADDYHASLAFDSIHGLEVGLSQIGALFTVLGRLGMTISHSKSKAILTCRGKGAESLKRRFVRSCGSITPRKLLISLWLIVSSILELWLVMGPLRIKHWSTDYKLVGPISGDSTKSPEADTLSTEEIDCAFGGHVCTLQACTALQPVASPAKELASLRRKP